MNYSKKIKEESRRAYNDEREKKIAEFHLEKQVQLELEKFDRIIVNNLRYIGNHFCSTFFCKRYSIFSDIQNLSWKFRGRIPMTNVYPFITIKITDNACRFSVDYIDDKYDEFITYQVYKNLSGTSEEVLEMMFVNIGISLAKAKAAAGKFWLGNIRRIYTT